MSCAWTVIPGSANSSANTHCKFAGAEEFLDTERERERVTDSTSGEFQRAFVSSDFVLSDFDCNCVNDYDKTRISMSGFRCGERNFRISS